MQFHEYVSSADNRIQNVPVYITVACFLVSEGASLECESVEGFTPLLFCDQQYLPLLKLFARPDRSIELVCACGVHVSAHFQHTLYSLPIR